MIILTSTVFDLPTRVMGGQTDGRAIAYSALSIYAICCRELKMHYNLLKFNNCYTTTAYKSHNDDFYLSYCYSTALDRL